mmetsp:Transcript_42922/g.101926  ORF Transcript_42922/g.101926 Transcript_42922/m.101926 type:complete len:523 (-) Transcript_42922:419-1987(-)
MWRASVSAAALRCSGAPLLTVLQLPLGDAPKAPVARPAGHLPNCPLPVLGRRPGRGLPGARVAAHALLLLAALRQPRGAPPLGGRPGSRSGAGAALPLPRPLLRLLGGARDAIGDPSGGPPAGHPEAEGPGLVLRGSPRRRGAVRSAAAAVHGSPLLHALVLHPLRREALLLLRLPFALFRGEGLKLPIPLDVLRKLLLAHLRHGLDPSRAPPPHGLPRCEGDARLRLDRVARRRLPLVGALDVRRGVPVRRRGVSLAALVGRPARRPLRSWPVLQGPSPAAADAAAAAGGRLAPALIVLGEGRARAQGHRGEPVRVDPCEHNHIAFVVVGVLLPLEVLPHLGELLLRPFLLRDQLPRHLVLAPSELKLFAQPAVALELLRRWLRPARAPDRGRGRFRAGQPGPALLGGRALEVLRLCARPLLLERRGARDGGPEAGLPRQLRQLLGDDGAARPDVKGRRLRLAVHLPAVLVVCSRVDAGILPSGVYHVHHAQTCLHGAFNYDRVALIQAIDQLNVPIYALK